MDFHVYHHATDDTRAQQITRLLQIIAAKVEILMTTVADIQAALARDEAAEVKIIGLLTSQAASLKDLAKQLADATNNADDVALHGIVDRLNADADAMEAAAASVTPPASAPTPDPTQATGTAAGSADMTAAAPPSP